MISSFDCSSAQPSNLIAYSMQSSLRGGGGEEGRSAKRQGVPLSPVHSTMLTPTLKLTLE